MHNKIKIVTSKKSDILVTDGSRGNQDRLRGEKTNKLTRSTANHANPQKENTDSNINLSRKSRDLKR